MVLLRAIFSLGRQWVVIGFVLVATFSAIVNGRNKVRKNSIVVCLACLGFSGIGLLGLSSSLGE